MQRAVEITRPVRRIVSLVPSQSELLVDLGLMDKLVGVTKFCVHPEGLKTAVQQIGGTKKVDIDAVIALQPDLVIGNKEENERSDIEVLEQHVPVWMSDITDVESALEMIVKIGELTETTGTALQLTNDIRLHFKDLAFLVDETLPPLKTLYLIWRKPYMAAGKGTFIDHCLSLCGLENCLEEARYPEIDLSSVQPELILLSSEPYPFREKHIAELQELFPAAEIRLVDGEYFSWYGSRMLGAPTYFTELYESLNR